MLKINGSIMFKVKKRQAWSVTGWMTTEEYQVL